MVLQPELEMRTAASASNVDARSQCFDCELGVIICGILNAADFGISAGVSICFAIMSSHVVYPDTAPECGRPGRSNVRIEDRVRTPGALGRRASPRPGRPCSVCFFTMEI